MLPRLILIADQIAAASRPLPDVVARAAEGVEGQLIVQIREPDLADDKVIRLVQAVQRRVPDETLISVNNRPAIARALGLGLHLPGYADAVEGGYALRGRSVHDAVEAEAAIRERADYAIVGTIFATASHPDRAGAGLEHLSRMQGLLGDIPCFAIGGMTAETAPLAIESGAWGVAVRSAILSAEAPAEAAHGLMAALMTGLSSSDILPT